MARKTGTGHALFQRARERIKTADFDPFGQLRLTARHADHRGRNGIDQIGNRDQPPDAFAIQDEHSGSPAVMSSLRH
jgi:hypothetical protein